jgi:hypothetical protein
VRRTRAQHCAALRADPRVSDARFEYTGYCDERQETGYSFIVELADGWHDPHGATTVMRSTYGDVMKRLRECSKTVTPVIDRTVKGA